MKTQSLDLTTRTIENLFKEGVCLTFDAENSVQYGGEIIAQRLKYKKHKNLNNIWTCSNLALLVFDTYNVPFHIFSNGVLIHAFDPTKDNALKFARIEKMLARFNIKLKQIYGPQTQFEFFSYDSFLKKISEEALSRYDWQKHIHFEPVPEKEKFLKSCFENNNILLTAAKSENLPFECRKYLALFDDGQFFISEDYASGSKIKDPRTPKDFKYAYREYFYLKARYVPQDYIDALYQKAETFEWFLPKVKSAKIPALKENKITPETKQMVQYVQKLLNNRKCISITSPQTIDGYCEVCHDDYVLFDDGTLVLSKDLIDVVEKHMVESLKASYPNLSFRIEHAPKDYIEAIYVQALKTHKNAKEIYLEILKQKARGLKKMLTIPHHEALELSAKIVGFKTWKEALMISETDARYAIEEEQKRKKIALNEEKDYLLLEYERYLNK